MIGHLNREEVAEELRRYIRKHGSVHDAAEFDRWLATGRFSREPMSILAPCLPCGHTPVVNSRGEVVDRHDCKYSQRVNALIEFAVAAADKSFEFWQAEHPDGVVSSAESDWAIEGRTFEKTEKDIWDGMYHRAMERMRSDAGVPLRRE